MSNATPTTRELLERMLAKVEEMRQAIESAHSAEVDSARAREALDDLERRVRAMMQETL
ncbi:MAG TPA: hypothetical protein VI007_09050 [bacterium]